MSKRTRNILEMCRSKETKVMETIHGNQQRQLRGKHEYVEKWLSQISPQGDKNNKKLLYITEQNCENDMENDSYPNKTFVDNSPSTSIISDSVQDPSYVPSESELSEVNSITFYVNTEPPGKSSVNGEIKDQLQENLNENIDRSGKSPRKEETGDQPQEVDYMDGNIDQSGMFPTDEETRDQPQVEDMDVGVEYVERINYKDRKDFCIFCEKDVSHFSRHLFTWHKSELEVEKIVVLKKNTKQRRDAITRIKKQGNFIKNRAAVKLRPVKRLQQKASSCAASSEYLPCKYCFGFYKRKSLYRHTKKCPQNTDLNSKKRQTAQSDGQTTILLHTLYKHDQLLTTKLFPRMRADEIGLTAKKDPLICAYAYSYIKGRQSKGNLDVVRQNVRRLSKLLLFARKQKPEIKYLSDLLQPSYFRIIIKGVNVIARYNEGTDIYESPTVGMNFGTLLKKCCDLAFIEMLEVKNSQEQRENFKILKMLIESKWSDEISAQAATNLNENKWNKNELLPFTTDLKKLNEFLRNLADEAHNQLINNNTDRFSYSTLKEVLFCQIILLNRRRPAEVAQLTVQTYKSINLQPKEDNEFQNCLTETEKILLNTYNRLVIRGKRGRGVPVLLSPQMKTHFDMLLRVRENFVSNNDFVFHTSGSSFIDGTKILQKYVKQSGVARPDAISATKLRKHLATITQLLQFSNAEMEQLSKFMGHTLKTHCSVYRMSDDIYQTAKVSKLLLLMMEKGVEQFKGKSLNEINIDLSPVVDNNDIFEQTLVSSLENQIENENEEISQPSTSNNRKRLLSNFSVENQTLNKNDVNNEPSTSNNTKSQLPPNKTNTVIRHSWTAQQKNIIASYFKVHIRNKQAPKKSDVHKFMCEYSDLFKDRKWTSIKAVVYNIYTEKLLV